MRAARRCRGSPRGPAYLHGKAGLVGGADHLAGVAFGSAACVGGATAVEAGAYGLALRDDRLGRLFVGGPADVAVFGSASYRQLPYRFAMNDVRWVFKAGRLCVQCPNRLR